MTALPQDWRALVDDAAIFPPGNASLPDAVIAYASRTGAVRELVGGFVVTEEQLPQVPAEVPVCVVASTGAVGGIERLAERTDRTLQAIEIALRDPADLAGNARRVVTAADDPTLLVVELPAETPTSDWLRAADEVAAVGARLKFRTGGTEADRFPPAAMLVAWIDAALDRETPFKCTAGLHHAIRHRALDTGFEHHGFLNVLLATRAAFDGATSAEVIELLDEPDASTVVTGIRGVDVSSTRRWFTSFGSCSVADPYDDLMALGLGEAS